MNSRAVALLGLLQSGFFLGGWMFTSIVARSQENSGVEHSAAIGFRHHYWWILIVPVIWTLIAAILANRGVGWFGRLAMMISSPAIGFLFAVKCISIVLRSY